MALKFLLTGDVDYTLVGEKAWITVKGISVSVRKTDEGVVVDLYEKGNEYEAIASTYAFDGETVDQLGDKGLDATEPDECEFEQTDDHEWFCKTHGCTLVGHATEPVMCASGKIAKGLEVPEVSKKSEQNWKNNAIQFPRLLAEIRANVDPVALIDVAASMDLEPEQVDELFDRAQTVWDAIKAKT